MDGKTILIEEEEQRTHDPDFWNEPKSAEEQLKKIARLKSWGEGYNRVKTAVEDLNVLSEFLEAGEATEKEVNDQFITAHALTEELESKNMLRNEEDSLGQLYEAVSAALGPRGLRWEMIFIDDGSTDSSMVVLRELFEHKDNVKVLSFGRNLGKSAALAVGFREAEGDVVVTIDADLQDDPAEIPKLLDALADGYDLVSGWKRERKDPLSKRLPSKLFNWVTSKLSGVRLHDMNCGLKAYRRQVVRTIKVYGELHRYTPVLAHFSGFRVTEVPVRHHARRFGKSKFGAERFARGLFDLVTILFLRRYVTRPLHLFGMIGGVLFLGGFGIGIYLTVDAGRS